MSQEELAYYRAVEDHFCRLRGTPFLFSPKDFAYLRQWWKQGIPLSAVLLALGEVFARRQQAGLDPVSSLAYCRHAVARQAKRLAQSRVGAQEASLDVAQALEKLRQAVEAAARQAPSQRLRELLASCLATLQALPMDLPPAVLAEMLAQVEENTLRAGLAALSAEEREALEAGLNLPPPGPEVDARAREVALLRALRHFLGLPRLELLPYGA